MNSRYRRWGQSLEQKRGFKRIHQPLVLVKLWNSWYRWKDSRAAFDPLDLNFSGNRFLINQRNGEISFRNSVIHKLRLNPS